MRKKQIAYYAHDEGQIKDMQAILGLSGRGWVDDKVVSQLQLFNSHGDKVFDGPSEYRSLFIYDGGFETEIMTYTKGPHLHSHRYEFRVRMPFLSHIGIYMDTGEPPFLAGNAPLVQMERTVEHSNVVLPGPERIYESHVYDTMNDLGHYTKLIWRVQP